MSKHLDIVAMDAAKRSQHRANAERWLANGTEAQKAAAEAALDELDRVEGEEEANRRQVIASLGALERVANAFKKLPPTDTEKGLLQVLLDYPDSSSEALSTAMKWRGQTWHMHFGEMCKKRESMLWPAEPAVVRDGNFYCGILAHFDDENGWRFKPEVAEGLAAIGIKPSKRSS
ncbi:hypothetical protein ACQZ6C_07905 [Rhizobium rhizogenes]